MTETDAIPNAVSCIKAGLAAGLLLAIGGCTAGDVAAETLSFQCEAGTHGGLPAMSFTYEGDASGTLSVTSSLGEMALPATRSEREGEVDGQDVSVTGIQASGPATLLMPERAAIEACIAGKARGDEAADADLVTMFVDSCRREAPVGQAPVPITAKIEIAIMEPPDLYVYLVLTYEEKSNLPGEHISIESLPPPSCTLAAQE